jgi:HEAT repeat protein
MRSIVLLIAAAFFAACSQSAGPFAVNEKPPTARNPDADAFVKRMKETGPNNLMQAALKTLSADFTDFNRNDAVLKQSMTFVGALSRYENGDSSALEEFGGVQAYKEKCAAWLNDEEQSIRAYAAVMLGLAGDKNYAPQLAEMLKERKYRERDKMHYDRGRAAIALGMIGAEEYKKELSALLKSAEYHDRQGGALALGLLKAKEFAPDVARLQDDSQQVVRADAVEALKMMGAENLIKKK